MEKFLFNLLDRICDKFPLLGGIINQVYLSRIPEISLSSFTEDIQKTITIFYKVEKVTANGNHLSQYMKFYTQEDGQVTDVTHAMWAMLGIGDVINNANKLTDYNAIRIMNRIHEVFPDAKIMQVVD